MKTHESIGVYESKLLPELAQVARALRAEIERALPAASSKVWHGHPVWFDGDNPVVGYDARKSAVALLFWNGQELGEPALVPVGKHRAAVIEYVTVEDIDHTVLQRCLDKARVNVLDSVGYFRALREKAPGSARRPARPGGRSTPKAKARSTRGGGN
jgi:hypothetical protein